MTNGGEDAARGETSSLGKWWNGAEELEGGESGSQQGKQSKYSGGKKKMRRGGGRGGTSVCESPFLCFILYFLEMK